MRQLLVLGLLCVFAPLSAQPLDPSRCAGEDAGASLAALRDVGFAVEDDARRQQLAQRLVHCLAHPDPQLRDAIAYAGLSQWLRADALDVATRIALLGQLQAALDDGAGDGDGFAAPFAALALSELARSDRVAAWMDGPQRAALVRAAAAYLAGVSDYRGFVDGQGWRHGVAHGADLAMQLALNEALDRAQLDLLVDAVLAQVPADAGHAYVFGEPGRLARPLLFAMRRGLHGDEVLQVWIARAADPGSLGSWDKAWESEAGLARRHNVQAFLMAMYVNLSAGSDERLRELLLPRVVEALRAMG